MQSSVEAFEPSEGYGATAQPLSTGARNWRGAAALKLAIMTLAVVAVLAISGVFASSDQEVVLGGDSMKTINSLLAHIDKITQSAKTGTSHDKAAKAKMLKATQDDDAADAAAPKAVRKGLGHMNKALEAAQAADDSLKTQGLHAHNSATEEKKKEAIAKKMRALTDQIQNDFKKVTGYGNKAGYVPPVKMPHM